MSAGFLDCPLVQSLRNLYPRRNRPVVMNSLAPRHSEILPRLPLGARVLVIRLRSLGDVVLLTPALAAVHRSRPDLRVTVLVEPGFAPLLEGNPAVEKVLPARSFGETVTAIRRGRY